MKKYLIAGVLALICNGMLTSCRENMEQYDSIEEAKKAQFAQNFEKFYGHISPTQDWGFGNASVAAARAMTRGKDDNSCGDCIKPDMPNFPNYSTQHPNYTTPAPITDGERAYVKNWFENNPGFTKGLDVSNFYIQHVWGQANKDYNVYWNVYDQNYMNNHFGATSNYYRNDFVTQATMDYLCVGDGENYTHALDFNANDDGTNWKMVYMQNSSALSFKYHSSWSSEEFKFFKCAEIEVPGNCFDDGQARKGLYVGLCCYGEKYDNGEQKLNYDMKEKQYADDWILKVVPGNGSTSTITKETKLLTKKTVLVHKWVFCEDLGSSSSNKDYDYNDLVFDAKIIDECKVLRDADGNEIAYPDDPGHTYYAELTPLAAGGELMIKFDKISSNIHGMFTPATADNVLINTCRYGVDYVTPHVEGLAGSTQKYDITSIDEAAISNIEVIVHTQNSVYDLSAEVGEAPHKICVPVGTRWAYERTDIKDAYTGFETYVQGGAEPWATTGDEDNLYPLDGVAYEMKNNMVGSSSYSELNSTSETVYSYTLADAANEHELWTGDTDFIGWDGQYALVIDKDNFAEVGNGTVLRFYGVAEGDFFVKAVYANSWDNVDLGDSRWKDDKCIYGSSSGKNCFELKLNTTTANNFKEHGMRLWGTNLKLLCVTYDNSNKVADEEPETPNTGSTIMTWTGSIVFGPYNLKSGNAFIDCSFNFDDLSSSPMIEVEFTRDNPENSWEPTDYYLKVCTQNGTAITNQISDSDGLSDADGKSHSSTAGTSFREVFTVSSSIMPTWREHYVGWNQKQIQLQGKNVTITKVTIHN